MSHSKRNSVRALISVMMMHYHQAGISYQYGDLAAVRLHLDAADAIECGLLGVGVAMVPRLPDCTAMVRY
jgi:hypothetical protein